MELYVFNANVELIHIIDEFTSLIWIRRYYKSGEFELHLPLVRDNIQHLKKGNIIYKKGDDEAGYIETRKISIDEKGQETLQVKGKFLTNYLNDRINWGELSFNGFSEVFMRKLVSDNCINPIDINRKIPLLNLGALKNYSEAVACQNSYGNIGEELESIALTSKLGYRIKFNHMNKSLLFEVYKGINRSVNQQLISPCIFSRDFENILNQDYVESSNNFKNTALVAGDGEGAVRTLIPINNDNIGLNRHELFIDAGNLRKEVNGKILSDAEYKNTLIQKGNEKLSEYKDIKTFDSKINTRGNNVYKVDYDLGDIVTISDSKWELRVDTRITEIEEIYEDGKNEINPVFGNNIPTIMDTFKRMVK
ncbi:MAG: siphovirus ReqiPepy6 Gp37-like family protein [Clostridium sp.]|uniref:siphovirus ReqiPepy6 Gp37-like family protein n=1 Tax=Clostridium sp. TaxID=1506 RepID=UPI00302FE07F